MSSSTISLTLCNSSDNTDGSMVLAKWWPTDDDFMYDRILHRTLVATDSSTASSSDYKQTVTLAQSLLDAPCGLRELWFLVRIGTIRFLAGCRKRRLNQDYFGFVRFSFWGFLCISLGVLYLSWLL